MKRSKIILIVISIISVAVIIAVCFLHKRTENVFDQIYYEVKAARRGKDSILLTGTETAYADYDLGFFVNVQIPDLDMCLDYDNKSLYLRFFNREDTEDCNHSYMVLYRYDLRDQKLYGERSLDYLTESFLASYFNWYINAGEKNRYSLQDLGSYTFILQDKVHLN